MDVTETHEDLGERVAESVRRALAFVGPSESGYERASVDEARRECVGRAAAGVAWIVGPGSHEGEPGDTTQRVRVGPVLAEP